MVRAVARFTLLLRQRCWPTIESPSATIRLRSTHVGQVKRLSVSTTSLPAATAAHTHDTDSTTHSQDEFRLFEAPGASYTHGVPALRTVRAAAFANTLGIGATVHVCSHLLQPEALAVLGIAMMLVNFSYQRQQTDLINQCMARHVMFLKLRATGERRQLVAGCEQLSSHGRGGLTQEILLERAWDLPLEDSGGAATVGGTSLGALVNRRLLYLDVVNGYILHRKELEAFLKHRVATEHRRSCSGAVGVGETMMTLSLTEHVGMGEPQPVPKLAVETVGRESMQTSAVWNGVSSLALVATLFSMGDLAGLGDAVT